MARSVPTEPKKMWATVYRDDGQINHVQDDKPSIAHAYKFLFRVERVLVTPIKRKAKP